MCLLQVALSILLRCERNMLHMSDMEDMVEYLKSEVPCWRKEVSSSPGAVIAIQALVVCFACLSCDCVFVEHKPVHDTYVSRPAVMF